VRGAEINERSSAPPGVDKRVNETEITMADKGDRMKDEGEGAQDKWGPTETHQAATQRFAPQFDRLREELDELLKLERAAKQIFATRPAEAFEGLSRVFDVVLPRDSDSLHRIARAVDIDATILQKIRASVIDPFDVPPAPVTALSRSMKMDFATFRILLQRDHERLAPSSSAAFSRATMSFLRDPMAKFWDAWQRDERDDPAPTDSPH
jgi:hypothetical protein